MRAQTNLLEVAQELEWKMSPRGLSRHATAPNATGANPAIVGRVGRGRTDAAEFAPLADDPSRLLRPELLKADAKQLDLPPTPFLDGAERGEGLVAGLPASARESLGELQTRAQEINARLVSINTQAAALSAAMQAAVAKMPDARRGGTSPRALLEDATKNLSTVAASSAPFQKLGEREQALIARGLQLPVQELGAINHPVTPVLPVDPGAIVRLIPPLRRPADSTPVTPPIVVPPVIIPRRPFGR